MKTITLLTFTTIFIFSIHRVQAQPTVFKHQIDATDVAELNKLGTALGISELKGWPVSAQEMNGNVASVAGVEFVTVDTTTRQIDNQQIIVYHMKVKTINLNSRGLSGKMPALSFSELITFNLASNNISGPIPEFNFPKCMGLILYQNQISGNIPVLNLPELQQLNLLVNQLTGPIPLVLPNKLVNLMVSINQLTGPLPMLYLPNLKYFSASQNQISGSIPNFGFPQLETLELEENSLTGNIPLFDFPKAMNIRLTANQLTGNVPPFNMPRLSNLALGDNQLTGTIPNFNMPDLILLNLKNNKLEGEFSNTGLPKLISLYLQNNNISGLPNLKAVSTDLTEANVQGNRLTFEDLETNVQIGKFTATGQQRVKCFQQEGTPHRFWVVVGGSQNSYQWYKRIDGKGSKIEGATKSSLEIVPETGAEYWCITTSSLVPGISLYSEIVKVQSCLTVSAFQFCIENGKWEDQQGNTLGASGRIIINDLLIFEGTATLDTLTLQFKASGEFYIENIPIGSGNIGKFSFGKGTYDLKLMGEDGMLTNFLGAKMDELGKLCGIDLKLKNMQLVGGRNANGIKIDCMVGVPGIAGSCGDDDVTKKTEFELKGLSFTSSGISAEGIEIADLGLFLKGYCLKKLEISYDSKKDILAGGAEVELPFGTIGGGLKLEEGFLDSIAWLLEAKTAPFVLGTTTIGIKGFFGHISSLTHPNIEIELGGIFSDITSDKIYKITASGRTIWPVEFGVKGTGQFLKPSLDDDFPFQLNGEVSLAYNIPDYLFKIAFKGKMGTLDEKKWLVQSEGKFNISLKNNPPVFTGNLLGTIHIEKFADNWYYNWLNSAFSLPIDCKTNNQFEIGTSRIIWGQSTFETNGIGPLAINYKVNLDKTYGEEGFLTWELDAALKSAILKSGNTNAVAVKQIVVPEKTPFAVMGISGAGKIPQSVLKSPSGKSYVQTMTSDKVVLSNNESTFESFWTLTLPEPGTWELLLTDTTPADSILVYLQPQAATFRLAVEQSGNQIRLTWDKTLFNPGDVLHVLFDDDNEDCNGFPVKQADATKGEYTFETSESYGSCAYYICAQAVSGFNVYQDYAPEMVLLAKTSLPAPEITAIYFSQAISKARVEFNRTQDINTAGYIVEVRDLLLNNSEVFVANAGQDFIEVPLKSYENKSVTMKAFDRNGVTGCPSAAHEIFSTLVKPNYSKEIDTGLLIYPNPAKATTTLRFTLKNSGWCKISIVDFSGRIITVPVAGHYPAGTFEETWDFGNLPSGMYFFVLNTGKSQTTVKCILNRN